jgi:branched-chain amino acid transport system permease protein
VAYVIAGLTLGVIYALASATIIVTYSASGVLNFAYGAQAYFVARMFYYLNTQKGWSTTEAGLVCILAVSPLIGIVLRIVLFRFLQFSSTLQKIVATIGLAVALPPAAAVLFGNVATFSAPGLAPLPVRVFHLFGTAITLDQVIALGAVFLILVVGFLVFRYTEVGLAVRATVDSPALASASGTNTAAVSTLVWAITSLLTGLGGILLAPDIGLSSTNFAVVMASAFAAVIVGKMRSIGIAVVVGLLIGIAGGVINGYVPSTGLWELESVNSIPFVITVVALLWYGFRRQAVESSGTGGFLDGAIALRSTSKFASQLPTRSSITDRTTSFARNHGVVGTIGAGIRRGDNFLYTGTGLVFAVVAIIPLVLGGQWISFYGEGLAFGIIFLSFTLLAGEGGMIWLCQITFAGIGAIATGQLAYVYHWPVLAALVVGGLVAVPFGTLVAVLTIRLGDLYIALATLTFGVLMDNTVFSLNRFTQDGQGVPINRPLFASGSLSFTYLTLVIFCLVACGIVGWRKSTLGLKLTAVRWSEPASETIGINTTRSKVQIAIISTFVAGLGGGVLAMSSGFAIPVNYATLGGLVWFAVLVTLGVRSIVAALFGGLSFVLIPAAFGIWVPASFLEVPTVLFGVGAVLVARHPEGSLSVMRESIEKRLKGHDRKVRRFPPVEAATNGPSDKRAALPLSGVERAESNRAGR